MATRIVTFLGLTNYRAVRHSVLGRESNTLTWLHDVATIEALRASGPGEPISLVVVGTAEVRRDWFEPGPPTKPAGSPKGPDAYVLELENRHTRVPTGLVEIPIGRTTAERWSIFEKVRNLLHPAPVELRLPRADGSEEVSPEGQPVDTIILDITHSFRSLPFFAAAAAAFSLAQHARDWSGEPRHKGPEIKILYAALEAAETDTEGVVTGAVPVWELTQFLEVLNWNAALDDMLRHGRADALKLAIDRVLTNERTVRPKTKEGQGPLRPLERLKAAATAFADDLVTARLPDLLTENAARLRDAAAEARNILEQLAPPLGHQVDGLVKEASQLVAGEVISEAGLQATINLSHLYHRLQRYSELSALLRETYVSAWSLRHRPAEGLLQPGAGVAFKAQRKRLEDGLHADTSLLRNRFFTFTQFRNDIQHTGFQPQPNSAATLRQQVDNYTHTLADDLAAAVDPADSAPLASPVDCFTFLNLSNHPSTAWTPNQVSAALALGHGPLSDLPFPQVPPDADTDAVKHLAETTTAAALALTPAAAFVAGEHSLTFALVRRLQSAGIPCYVATTERVAAEERQPDGSIKKISEFRFVAWRRYPEL
jgi:CRISPR-associated DxTHG motif protein